MARIELLLSPTSSAGPDRRGPLLVFLGTFIGAFGQILMKRCGSALAGVPFSQLLANPALLLTNWPLLAGYSLYGITTGLLILALRRGQLSVLYPIISLGYVWVLILSAVVFREAISLWKVAAVVAIVAGVGILGRSE